MDKEMRKRILKQLDNIEKSIKDIRGAIAKDEVLSMIVRPNRMKKNAKPKIALKMLRNNNDSNETYYLQSGDCIAKGILKSGNKFMVLKDSTINLHEAMNDGKYIPYHNKREHLISTGVIKGKKIIKDFITNSPSEAANILLGHRVSGIVFWKDNKGKSIRQKQAREKL